MARDLEHLELPRWEESLPRRRRRGDAFKRDAYDRKTHGTLLMQQANELVGRLAQRPRECPRGINPKLIFKLQLHPKAELEEEKLGQMDLHVLARSAQKAIVVFPDEGALSELRGRLKQYAGVAKGHEYAYLDAIEELAELTPEDRTGSKLKSQPLGDHEVAALDIEVWHTGNTQECRRFVKEITDLLHSRNLRVTDTWIGQSMCIARAHVNRSALSVLLDTDYVKEIDRRSDPSFEMLDVARLDLGQLDVDDVMPDDAVGVIIVDSGVMQAHPLIGPALGDAQVFPDSLRKLVKGGPEDGDQSTGGHGTAVAGIAIYNDVGACIADRRFSPTARLFSARVTGDDNKYDEDELLEHQLEAALDYFLTSYPSAKVVNISLGDRGLVYDDGRYQFRFAAALDEFAYRYRDREIVFVVSAGNFFPSQLTDEEILASYPQYLLDDPLARLIDPATSAIALTVGGLSYGAGRQLNDHLDGDVNMLVAQERGHPSPFTRTGPGIKGAIKPELVDFAGDLRFERGRIFDAMPAYAGLPTTARDFAPPEGRLFRTVAGTSFAAPRVANIAAQLFREYPEASSNMIRALIASSAQLPSTVPQQLADLDPSSSQILRIYGYGQADLSRALHSAQNDVLVLADSKIQLDQFHLYEIPSLPEEFLTAHGKGYLSVTLAFDPPTRHTRADGYLGASMGFQLFRNTTPEVVSDTLKAWAKDEREKRGEEGIPGLSALRTSQRVELTPGWNQRAGSTLQRGTAAISSQSWQYDGGPLILAAICQAEKWVPGDITEQRYAVVVTVRHESEQVPIYVHLRHHLRVYQRVRVRV